MYISILGTCKWSVDPLCPVTFAINPHSFIHSFIQYNVSTVSQSGGYAKVFVAYIQ